MATMKGCTYCGKSMPTDATVCPHCHAENKGEQPPADIAVLTQGLTTRQRALFDLEYEAAKKNPTTGVVLSLLLGGLGAHHFYMGSWIVGVLYLLFSWTFVPMFLGLVEAFLMGGRVRDFNRKKAQLIAARLHVASEAAQAPAVAS